MAGRKRNINVVSPPSDNRPMPATKRRRSRVVTNQGPLDRTLTRSRTRGLSGVGRLRQQPELCSSSDSEPEPPSPQQIIQQMRLSDLTNGIKCPVCSKFVLPDDIECHLVMCLTKPRLIYNEDVLNEDKGECVICLEELTQGDTIARLPCLCIYHKSCIDRWFDVNRSCPEHPGD